jgi:hypothetical protein
MRAPLIFQFVRKLPVQVDSRKWNFALRAGVLETPAGRGLGVVEGVRRRNFRFTDE